MGNRKIASRQHAPKFMQELHGNERKFYTQSCNKELFSVLFSVCVGALFPGQRKNSVWPTRAHSGMLIHFERYHMAGAGDQTREVTLLS